MASTRKDLESPCYDVLDWLIDHPDAGAWERSAALTVREDGLHGAFQENVLTDACRSSGMREACPHADECGIDRQPAMTAAER